MLPGFTGGSATELSATDAWLVATVGDVVNLAQQSARELSDHRGNVGLVEEKPRGMPPAIAVLGPIMREREDVVGSLANGAQDSAALDR
jgi:hypothetical protein